MILLFFWGCENREFAGRQQQKCVYGFVVKEDSAGGLAHFFGGLTKEPPPSPWVQGEGEIERSRRISVGPRGCGSYIFSQVWFPSTILTLHAQIHSDCRR